MTALDPGLHRAVLWQPEEDLPRLLCAEWLDENAETVKCGTCVKGAPLARRSPPYKTCVACFGSGRISDGRAELAEFVRVQVELARGGGERVVCKKCNGRGIYTTSKTTGDTPPKGRGSGRFIHGRRVTVYRKLETKTEEHVCFKCNAEGYVISQDALRRRERDLMKAMRDKPVPRFAPNGCYGWDAEDMQWFMGGEITGKLSRGFVSAISLPCAAFLAHAPAIFRSQPVERITLIDKRPEDDRGFMWFRGDGDPAGIPARIFDEIPGDLRVDWGEYYKGFETPELAFVGLSAGAVQYGRALVGLPPLPADRPAPAAVPEVMR